MSKHKLKFDDDGFAIFGSVESVNHGTVHIRETWEHGRKGLAFIGPDAMAGIVVDVDNAMEIIRAVNRYICHAANGTILGHVPTPKSPKPSNPPGAAAQHTGERDDDQEQVTEDASQGKQG